MKTSINVIKKLAQLRVIPTQRFNKKEDGDIIVPIGIDGINEKVILDGITDEDLPLMIMAEQLKTLKTIKKGVIFFVVLSVISIIISIIGAVNMASLF